MTTSFFPWGLAAQSCRCRCRGRGPRVRAEGGSSSERERPISERQPCDYGASGQVVTEGSRRVEPGNAVVRVLVGRSSSVYTEGQRFEVCFIYSLCSLASFKGLESRLTGKKTKVKPEQELFSTLSTTTVV